MSPQGPSLLWIPLAIVVGAAAGYLVPLFDVPYLVLYILHAIVIFHLALSLPLLSIGRAVGNGRVWRALLILNLVIAPVLAFVLSRVVWHTPEMQIGVLLVLLAPGISLALPVIRGAGGDAESVLGVMPVFLAVVLLIVPVFTVFLSGGVFTFQDVVPTLIPVGLIVGVPVILAAVFQALFIRRPGARAIGRLIHPRNTVGWAALALGATAFREVSFAPEWVSQLGWLVPLSIAFLVLMAPVSLLVSSLAGVSADKRRAILISAVGRGGLVIVPISLTLDHETWGMVPLVILVQIAIEAVGLMVYRSITPEIVLTR